MTDAHCQHILFGGSADNGYARVLEPYVEDETVRGKITLLEGPPFARELAVIKDKFRVASFANVFRHQKLFNNKRRISFHITPPATPSVDYASVAGKAPSTSAPPPTTQLSPSRVPVSTQVLRNRMGQRVDAPLKYSFDDFMSLKARKLCNSFHLLGKCSSRAFENYGKCQHDHDGTLNRSEMEALRAVARQSPCQRGLECNDPDCPFGHRCTRINCAMGDCRFSRAMNNVDTKIVS